MNWNIVAGRTSLFAFVWGTMFCGAVLPAVLGVHGGYLNAVEAIFRVIVVEIMSCCFGVLPALLYCSLLGFYERDKAERTSRFLVVSFLICAVYELPIFAWIATGPGTEYGPDGWVSGGLRIGAAGYIAALVAGYFVARHPADQWVKRSKSSAVVYVIGAIVAFWLISAMLFPTFQAVKANSF